MKNLVSLLTMVSFIMVSVSHAQVTADIKGSKDNPLISRMDGAFIAFEKTVKWDNYILPVSKIIKVEGQNAWEKRLKLAGEVNRLQYTISKDNNASYVYANYMKALKEANWELLFSGNGEEELGNSSYEWQYTMFQEGLKQGDKFGNEYDFRGGNYAYITAKYEEADTSFYAMIYIVEKDDFTLITQDIIKVKNPDTGMVTAKMLKEKIDHKGHLALDGIYFETGKATITGKSKAALKNIASFLNANKEKKFFIVGHTDNTGNFASNMTLSENRAKAVMQALINDYGVDAAQLQAYGVAGLCPVTSNATDEGKSRNRRVEIVEQ